ncbi:MAG TPA: hypothetical protein PLU72_14975, partial [Candidatus Ozemobacteraceae bacterium]|nr:hypothetical protein [Candidatus Ozemobacteraceae bacterium]
MSRDRSTNQRSPIDSTIRSSISQGERLVFIQQDSLLHIPVKGENGSSFAGSAPREAQSRLFFPFRNRRSVAETSETAHSRRAFKRECFFRFHMKKSGMLVFMMKRRALAFGHDFTRKHPPTTRKRAVDR